MHKILILEDETAQRTMLYETIKNSYNDWEIIQADSYDSAKKLLEQSIKEQSHFTLFLLDVQLSDNAGDRGGFFIAREIRKQMPYFMTPILFLTAVSDEGSFALSQFHCYNYISKPYSSKDILFQIEQMLLTGYMQNMIQINDTTRIRHKIFINDIYTIESSKGHTITLSTKHGDYTTREYSLESIQDKLGENFIRCHRKTIINKQYLINYDKSSQFVQVNDKQISVGRTYMKKIEQLI